MPPNTPRLSPRARPSAQAAQTLHSHFGSLAASTDAGSVFGGFEPLLADPADGISRPPLEPRLEPATWKPMLRGTDALLVLLKRLQARRGCPPPGVGRGAVCRCR